MAPKDKRTVNFRTMRIFGKSAQELIESAKEKLHSVSEKGEEGGAVSFPLPEKKREIVVVSLSVGSVVKAGMAILGFVALAYLLYHLRDKVILILLAVFLSVVIDPGVAFFERHRIPRAFSILLVYLIVVTIVLFLIISFIPIIAEQIQQMSSNLTQVIEKFMEDPRFSIPLLNARMNSYLTAFVQQIFQDISFGGILAALQRFGERLYFAGQGSLFFVVGVAGSVLQFVVKFILVLVLTFFLQMEKERVTRWVRLFFPYRYRRYVETKSEMIHGKLAMWIHGQMMLSLAIGGLVFTALTILKMPYALTLAVLAAFTEFIPVVGPIFAAIPAILIAMAQVSFFFAVVTGLVYYGIQWCENNLLVPLIMRRAVGLSPIAVISAMLIGVSFPNTIHPILGVLLAVPMATILSVFVKDLSSPSTQGGTEEKDHTKL